MDGGAHTSGSSWRRPAAVALMLVFAAAAIELHPGSADHSADAGATAVAIDARHARQAPHLEPSRLELRHGCARCLVQRPKAVTLTVLLASPAAPIPEPSVSATGVAAPRGGRPGPSAPRAPPLS